MPSLVLAAAALSAAALVPLHGAWAQGTRLLRHPAVSRDAIAFEYGGDLWAVSRAGGAARRLTATPEMDTDPAYSPDGSLIAFTHMSGAGDASDVYVMSAAGGDARRVTFYPGVNRVRGWTPDGKRIVFASDRVSVPQASYLRLFTVSKDGGAEDALPMPRAFSGTFSPDGRRVAYEEISTVFIPGWFEASGWRHYRGGRTHPISIMNLADHSVEKLPWKDSNDSDPVWVGNTVYFLSDRNFTTNVFSYRVDTKELKQLTTHDDYDVANLSATDDGVVYEQGGWLHLIDPRTGVARPLAIDVAGDFAWARPQFKKVAPMIRQAALSPTGARAVFEARGDIFTVPAEKGDWRNLTRSAGAHDHSPAWSPDGSQVAYLSDQSGEFQLMIGDQLGAAKPRAIALPGTGYFSQLAWSPDGRRVTVEDNHLGLWVIDLATDHATRIDADTYNTPGRGFDATWSPDSRWLSYSKSLPSHLRAIFVRSLDDGRSFQLTDGFADATSPAFDAGGRYLYFLASTDVGLRTSWLDMSQLEHQVRRVPYLVVLRADDPSPLLPESSEEPAPPARGAPIVPARAPAAAARPATPDSGVHVEPSGRSPVRIDEPGIRQRILALGIPGGDLEQLTAGSAETFFFAERAAPAVGGTLKLQRFQIKDRAVTTVLEGIRSFSLSADHKKLLYSAGAGANARWGIVSTERPVKVGDGALNLAQVEMRVDPAAEWAEIFRESWRTQREYFYDAKMHGADWKAVFDKYNALVPWVRHRADLSYLMAQVGGELVVGHSYITGPGDESTSTPTTTGLLGADYAVENGLYRIKRIYGGESWNPELRAPLSGPGVHVAVDDYLLEVDGRPVTAARSVYEPFEETVGRQTVIRVGPGPSAEGSRLVTVVPVASEEPLRTRAWIEDNRRKVDSLSNGRLAYVWLPNTGQGGYTAFTRYFFSQQDKQGAVIDERYNHGGMVADFIVGELSRRQTGGFAMRDGLVATSPTAGIYGPKVLLINESAGSGGDALPYNFRVNQIGPLIGTRTWGGLVGTTGTPPTIDGGGVTAPSLAFFDLKNQWAIENEGVAPDIEVENDAASVIAGHDPQLERGVQEAMRLLAASTAPRIARPRPIDRTSAPARTH